jgi:predicted ATP-grasp superfamily ATP-dependent carboligase
VVLLSVATSRYLCAVMQILETVSRILSSYSSKVGGPGEFILCACDRVFVLNAVRKGFCRVVATSGIGVGDLQYVVRVGGIRSICSVGQMCDGDMLVIGLIYHPR